MDYSNKNYQLLHPYYYPTNHTQAGVTSASPCIYYYQVQNVEVREGQLGIKAFDLFRTL